MSRRIAEIARAYMAEHEHEVLVWGDGALVNIARRAGIDGHPIDAMQKVVNALARAPGYFETFRIHGCDIRGRSRITRGFKPIAQPEAVSGAVEPEIGAQPR